MLNKHTLVYSLITACLVHAEFDAAECGKSKGCVRAPEGCTSNDDCKISFSYKIVDEGMLEIEISAHFTLGEDANEYTAVGFSKDDKMGDDLVVYCARMGSVTVYGLAVNREERGTTVMAAKGSQALIAKSDEDGIHYCKLRQPQNPLGNDTYRLDTSYHILLASGPFEVSYLDNHGPNRYAMQKVSLTDFGGKGGAGGAGGATGQGATVPGAATTKKSEKKMGMQTTPQGSHVDQFTSTEF
ncbi:hypothetical protein Y032_0015g2575 [Ancylostoma ceylanicum]|uniref:DOMON domain-containing protein n=1 Tax=Ancylostoma ceylanicum TaxID=53326 RepID=A0A016V7N6_9BILA|nr:hypothetical protein Y032_0015g2575 [Ancylostoma ceylanicum]